MELRIGINVGDVIVEGDDLFGDGVNVAARLEGLAEPGGAYLSGTVFDQVKDKLDVEFDDLGPRTMKNIVEPVRTYRVRLQARGTVGTGYAVSRTVPDVPSIAVLPFVNMSGDAEQGYFSDGIAEDIITDLSKISGLFVIARNSSFTFKGKSVDVKQVASALGVRYVLEGGVRKAADRVRITAQLIDGTTGGHLWADRYDRVLDDIFVIQDEITRNIVAALKVRLALDERERLGGASTASIEAYDFMLRGRELLYREVADANAEAVDLFEKSIALDPKFIPAYWGLAYALFTAYTNGWNEASEATLDTGFRMASTAVELDATDPQGHWALALGHMWQRDLDAALAQIERAVVLGPSNAEAYAVRGYILSYAHRPVEAIESFEKSMRLNPRHPAIWLHFLAHAHFVNGDYEQAAALLNRRIRRQPSTDISRALLASCYGHLGRSEEAVEQWAKVLEINPDYSIERKGRVLPYKDPADWDRLVGGLRKAGVPA